MRVALCVLGNGLIGGLMGATGISLLREGNFTLGHDAMVTLFFQSIMAYIIMLAVTGIVARID